MPPAQSVVLAELTDRLMTDVDFGGRINAASASRTVSAVLPTYNRCPFDPSAGRMRDNPLTWALDSLLAQHGDALGEVVVVVDDRTTDHTSAVLVRYAVPTGTERVPVRVVRWSGCHGLAATRNAGLRAARCPWVVLGDDDCVFAPHYVTGAAHTAHVLAERDPAVAGVMLPFYYRALRPRQVVPTGRIGVLDPDRAEFATRFHAWPDSWLPEPPLLDETGVVAPLPVRLIGGTAILNRDRLADVGGFRHLPEWRTAYSEHLHLAADLTDAGASLYHCPDPRLSAVHLKFGAAGRFPLHDADLDAKPWPLGRPLRELVELASEPRTDTGCRVTDDGFHAEMIGSFFAFFAERSPPSGAAWAIRTWDEFVEQGQLYSLTITRRPDRAQRERSWREGLARGARSLLATRPRHDVAHLLAQIGIRTGQTPVTVP